MGLGFSVYRGCLRGTTFIIVLHGFRVRVFGLGCFGFCGVPLITAFPEIPPTNYQAF